MKNPNVRQGNNPFNQPLNLNESLASLWQTALPFSHLSPRMDMRYQKRGSLLLRANLGSDNYEEAQAIIDLAEQHFARLQRFGVRVVSHLSEVHENIEPDMDEAEDSRFVIISASKYITQLRPLNKKRAARNVPAQHLRETIFNPLGKYLDWADSELPPYILDDIYTPDQYGWQESSGLVLLHDIDPRMGHNTPGVTREHSDRIVETFKRLDPAVAFYF